jgi:hypothetical protein
MHHRRFAAHIVSASGNIVYLVAQAQDCCWRVVVGL